MISDSGVFIRFVIFVFFFFFWGEIFNWHEDFKSFSVFFMHDCNVKGQQKTASNNQVRLLHFNSRSIFDFIFHNFDLLIIILIIWFIANFGGRLSAVLPIKPIICFLCWLLYCSSIQNLGFFLRLKWGEVCWRQSLISNLQILIWWLETSFFNF